VAEAVPGEGSPSSDLAQWPQQLAEISSQLNAGRTVQEPAFSSRLPFIGSLVAALRRFWNHITVRWYVRALLDQQNAFNAEVVRSFDALASMVAALKDREMVTRKEIEHLQRYVGGITSTAQPTGDPAAEPIPGGRFGFTGRPEEAPWPDLDQEAIQRWEDADLPPLGQHSLEVEVRADEREDEEFTANHPLYWRSWSECWRYLFDFGMAGESLACRPGDLVLDYAAGSCWVAEFLNRLGIRTVSVDLSPEMLRRGQQRMAVDQRLNRFAVAHFSAADALQLPFVAESFDGVICMNALHHMPSYEAALAEIFRVLKKGGRAVFSEPGADHARNPISQTRMAEEGVLEKGVPLPLIYFLARRVGFTRMRVMPLIHALHYLFDYSASPADYGTLHRLWQETIKRSPFVRAFFVLEKGPERPLDSRMPPQTLLSHLLRAEIDLVQTCPQVQAGQEFTDTVKVRNSGDIRWVAQASPFGGQVTLGVKVCTTEGRIVCDVLGRTSLPHDVAPGEEVILPLHFTAALEPGMYLLKYDMVVEHVTWFEQYGATTVQRPLEVIA
jgi:ubiquinone/menaquinone biosynthesis C-methylase UbiE